MRAWLVGLAALAPIGATGCGTMIPVTMAGRDAALAAYQGNRGTQTFPAGLEEAREAVAQGMDDLQMHTIRPSAAGELHYLDGSTVDGRHVRVLLQGQGEQTVVTARIGTFGDEAMTRALLDRVGVRLGTLPPAPAPVDPPSTPGTNPFVSREAVPNSVMIPDVMRAGYQDSLVPR